MAAQKGKDLLIRLADGAGGYASVAGLRTRQLALNAEAVDVTNSDSAGRCLTLGALAELEEAFGAADLSALAARFSTGRLAAGDLLRLLGAGLRGGGHAMSDAEVRALPVAGALPEIADAVAAMLEATFGAAEAEPRETRPFPSASV